MATYAPTSDNEDPEDGQIVDTQSIVGSLVQKMNTWLENRTIEVDLITSFLERGYGWPLPNVPRPGKKKQRRQLRLWVKENQTRIDKIRREKGVYAFTVEGKEEGYQPTEEQKKEWAQLHWQLQVHNCDYGEMHAVDMRIRGLIKEVLRGESWPEARQYIPKDHWVYLTLKNWLKAEEYESDRQAELKRDELSYMCKGEISESLMDELMVNYTYHTNKGPLKSQPALEKVMESQTAQKGYTERPSSPFRVTKRPSSPIRATRMPSPPFGVTEKSTSPFGATESQSTHKSTRTVTVNAIANSEPWNDYQSDADPTDDAMDEDRPCPDPAEFCRTLHLPVTLEEELETGTYPCLNNEEPIQEYINWQLFLQHTERDSWTHVTTQDIMEGRALSLHDYELESWAAAIDKDIGVIPEDEETGDWWLTDQQHAQITHNIRSAVRWFKKQPMSRRLHQLSMDGWLVHAVRLYTRGRGEWPWQMGPRPMSNTEHRLVELWENSIMRNAPPLPTAIDDYRKWWNSVDQQKLTHEKATKGYQVLSNAVRLREGLQNIWPHTRDEEQMRDYILRDYTWPISDQLVPPDSMVERAVIADWWANRRERLTSKWDPKCNPEERREAERLWHSCTALGTPKKVTQGIPSRRNVQRQRKRAKRTHQQRIAAGRVMPASMH